MPETNLLHSSDYRTSVNRHVLDAVPAGTTCLDVGCWNGNLGRLLREEKGCTVDGVDFIEGVLQEAREEAGYRQTFRMNLNGEALEAGIIGEYRYDRIIFADVLEHLVNPEEALRFFGGFLKPGGQVVISLPNVAFALNRLQLLLGRWEYRDYGILDKTHLRFFTLDTGSALVRRAGFRITRLRPYNQFGILRRLDPPFWPRLLAYQFLIQAALDHPPE